MNVCFEQKGYTVEASIYWRLTHKTSGHLARSVWLYDPAFHHSENCNEDKLNNLWISIYWWMNEEGFQMRFVQNIWTGFVNNPIHRSDDKPECWTLQKLCFYYYDPFYPLFLYLNTPYSTVWKITGMNLPLQCLALNVRDYACKVIKSVNIMGIKGAYL